MSTGVLVSTRITGHAPRGSAAAAHSPHAARVDSTVPWAGCRPPAGPVAMLPAITRLTAPEPGWVAEADVVIVGSGIAGLTAALRIAARGDLRVMVVTKDVLSSGSTRWAQGGIAAALGVDDTTDEHLADTLVAGVGLCEVDAVRVLVDEGPAAVRELVDFGHRRVSFAAVGRGVLTVAHGRRAVPPGLSLGSPT